MTTYAERDATLLVLGFKSYRDYLDSGIWKSIRNAVLTRSDGICSVCGSLSANQVHHRDYSETTLMGRNLSSLIPICSVCHHAAERDGKGRKQSLSVANRTINVLSAPQNIQGDFVSPAEKTLQEKTNSFADDVADRLCKNTPSHHDE